MVFLTLLDYVYSKQSRVQVTFLLRLPRFTIERKKNFYPKHDEGAVHFYFGWLKKLLIHIQVFSLLDMSCVPMKAKEYHTTKTILC